MAKSSIVLEYHSDIAVGYFYHNSREKPTVNSIFKDAKNYTNVNAQTAVKKFYNILGQRIVNYEKNTGKKMQKKTIKHISAIVNLNKEHTASDIKKLIKYLEEEFDTKVVQYSIHRDEGHINENGEKIHNYHAHLEMVGIDSQGKSIRRRMTRQTLINLQTQVANILNMERGQSVRKTKRKRLNTYEYKEAMKLKNEELAELKKALKNNKKTLKNNEKIIKKLKAENEQLKQKLKLNKEQKSKAIKLLKELRNDIKNINKIVQLFIAEDYKKISEVQKQLRKNNITEIKELKQTIKELIKYFEYKLKEYEIENMQQVLEYNELVKQLKLNKQTDNRLQQIQQTKQKLQQYSDYDFGL